MVLAWDIQYLLQVSRLFIADCGRMIYQDSILRGPFKLGSFLGFITTLCDIMYGNS